MPTQLKLQKFVVPKDDPFANDKLDRKKCIDALTKVVQNGPGPLVISINGRWGTGKTVFLEMWNQALKNNSFTTVYFNAWQDDYCHDPLVALIGQIWNELKDSDLKEIANSVKKCAAPVFRTTIFNAIRTASAGVIDLNESQLKSISEKVLDEYVNAGKKLKDLKERLSELSHEVGKKGKPLIIIIDELDRCRPTFAIELLEKVKHLFDTPGILFILGIDREQISHSIKSVYGHEMDVNGYLRRFIDIEFVLPEAKTEIFISHIFEQLGLHECFEKRKLATQNRIDDKSGFDAVSSKLCECFQLSLRDIEHCCRILTLAYMNTDDRHFTFPYLLMVLVIVKSINNELYCSYVSGQCDIEDIINFILKQPHGERFLNTFEAKIIYAHLIAVLPEERRNIILNQIKLLCEQKELNHPEALPNRIKKMPTEDLDRIYEMCSYLINDFRGLHITHKTLGYLSKKIELASLMLDYTE